MSQADTPLNPVEPVIKAPSLGEWLIATRQAKNLSVQDVASRTNRSVQQITAIEADDYATAKAPSLLRAFVRHYAKAIGVDEQEAISHMPPEYRTIVAPAPMRDAQLNRVFTHNGTPLKSPWISRTILSLVALAVFGFLAYWIFGARFMKDSLKNTTEPNQVEVVSPVAVVAPPPAPVVAPTPVGDVLTLKFNTNSWVQVKDAKGKILLNGDQVQGSTQTVTGELPLSAQIVHASQVEATWKGEPYDLKPLITNKSLDKAVIKELK